MSEVTAINRESKTVTVLNRTKNTTYEESYDKLVLSPGAAAIVPPIPGIEQVNRHVVRNVGDVVGLKKSITPAAGQKIAVIGGGFIGVEVAENLNEAGYAVTLVEAMPQILRIYDADMVQFLHKALIDHGIELVLNDKVASFEKDTVVLGSGRKIEAAAVVMAIGVAPETKLAKAAGLTLGSTGAIAVDAECRTNDPDIYAVGDAIEVQHALLNEPFKIALAWPAQIQARGAADSIKGLPFSNPAYIGSSCIKVFEWNAASTGLIKGSVNIPLSQLRKRLDEIPRDRPVYVHCRSGQRSYNAVRALQNLGYDQVYNMAGGFLFFSFLEHMQERLEQRAPVLTGYNFD